MVVRLIVLKIAEVSGLALWLYLSYLFGDWLDPRLEWYAKLIIGFFIPIAILVTIGAIRIAPTPINELFFMVVIFLFLPL